MAVEDNISKNHILPVFGAEHINAVTETDVLNWLAGFEKRKCATSTRNRRLYVLKSIFNLAVKRGLLAHSHIRDIHSKRVKRNRWPTLSTEYLSVLWDALMQNAKREAKAIALLLLTGARKNEILHARWENLFLEENFLLVPRMGTPNYRKIWLSAEARGIFQTLPRRRDSPWVFPGRDVTKPISDIFLFWKELREQLGLEKLSIRDLRHVFADWQVRSGMSPIVVQRSLGIQDRRDVENHLFHRSISSHPARALTA